VTNPFIHPETLKYDQPSAMSLSVYNRPEQIVRPKTANVNMFSGVPGLEPVEMTEEGIPIARPDAVPCVIPDFDLPETEEWDLKLMPRTANAQARLE
jgi:hypothetical protein